MRIIITGSEGLIGRHFRAYLLSMKHSEVVLIDRASFNDQKTLSQSVQDADVIVHLAGVNRGTDDEVYQGNILLAEKLIETMAGLNAKPHVLFSTSTHIEYASHYGRSKKQCGELFSKWASDHKTKYSEVVLPHVFGEGGKPFYNSVVSTFCHQLSEGQGLEIIKDSGLELVHCREVSEHLWRIIETGSQGTTRLSGKKILVSELKQILEKMHHKYLSGVIPRFSDVFDLHLFNTLRSYRYPKHYPVYLEKKSDDRGFLFEAVKTDNGGQGFLSKTKPGITRGNHWHLSKVERFCVVQGQAIIRIRSIFGHEVREFPVDCNKPCFIDIPTLHTHNITNSGSGDLMTLFWSHEIFDPKSPDTFSLNLNLGS